MKTIILPGYSVSNKNWAEEVSEYLNEHKIETIVHYWDHWRSGSALRLSYELGTILKHVHDNGGTVNIIAKSVGTMVIAKFLEKNQGTVDKLILCGIPSTSDKRLEIFKRVFSDFPAEKIVSIQNTKDPFANYFEVKKFMAKINPQIKVLEKPRNDHNYPYLEMFEKFLKR